MEIFCRNVPEHLKDKHLEKEFRPILAELKIFTFSCRKLSSKGHALLTIPDAQKARDLLSRYPKPPRGQRRNPGQLLRIFNVPIFIEQSRNPPDPFHLRALEEEERKRLSRKPSTAVAAPAAPKKQRSFFIVSLSCGVFDYSGDVPVFVDYFYLPRSGKVVFGKRGLNVTIENIENPNGNPLQDQYQVEFDYSTIAGSIYLGGHDTPSITFSCHGAPRLFRESPNLTDILGLRSLLNGKKEEPLRKRICHLGPDHKVIVATCFTYRVVLSDPTDIYQVRNLSSERHIPHLARWIDRRLPPFMPYAEQLGRFLIWLSSQKFPFQIKYQLQMLVWNGVLPIKKVVGLSRYVSDVLSRRRVEIAAKTLQELPRKLQFPGPDVEKSEFSIDQLVQILTEIEEGSFLHYLESGKRGYTHEHQIAIHRVTVTPTGIFLYGPYVETKNRVLRRYEKYSDHFLRVEFLDESGDAVQYDPRANLDEIFNSRFKEVLKSGIIVADRRFEFLGFSNSSLRAQSCWFVAPFTMDDGESLDASSIIPKLGNFEHIRSPSKYAARIGQTFSDTMTSIAVDRNIVKVVDDVTRNGRVFSDGCGTVSKGVLYKIYREYALRARVKPTVFQVRFSGAKGMLSVDFSKKDEEIMLRKSMVKFEAVEDYNIEICGAGTNALPFFLNAQIIKIFEDLGVPLSSFLELQEAEVEELKSTIQSLEQAARFLEQSHIAKSTQLPWLIRFLRSLGLHHRNDRFLRQAVELTAIMKLRDLKYRARIRVPKAVTLYGIMDETGILNEGEIFCSVLSDTFHREILVHKKVIITRSPALHPGDIQLVNAVDVPQDSPLRRLHNCVVFSQKGSRDLPSKLSGGDLDGDLYNIIYDERLMPTKIVAPADYPRVQENVLDQPVARYDIIDFFVTFMQQDQLGRIANIHKVLADQRPEGTFHGDCLTLAELHSTAVDFPKTGKPVDLGRIPKCRPYRPDFMAPSPRVHVEEDISILEQRDEKGYESDDEDGPRLRYYRSERALGYLYRAIDEQTFLQDLKSLPKIGGTSLLDQLWSYVDRQTAGFLWDHCIEDAEKVKEVYEDNMQDLMYQYSASPWKTALTELEVFIGTIMGENSKISRRQKESSNTMREQYDRLVEFTMSMILDRETGTESLERSIACFWVGVRDAKAYRPGLKQVKLESFTWIAAVACLQEVERLQALTFHLF
ncbi:hypothetical protein VTN00DRAFT_8755 [Thermoascus crustaceus]|uniref:uncharacterized protein n=1 Tax=Thermoascus crustaceus TaxID=5088 RepID=UPI0037445F73